MRLKPSTLSRSSRRQRCPRLLAGSKLTNSPLVVGTAGSGDGSSRARHILSGRSRNHPVSPGAWWNRTGPGHLDVGALPGRTLRHRSGAATSGRSAARSGSEDGDPGVAVDATAGLSAAVAVAIPARRQAGQQLADGGRAARARGQPDHQAAVVRRGRDREAVHRRGHVRVGGGAIAAGKCAALVDAVRLQLGHRIAQVGLHLGVVALLPLTEEDRDGDPGEDADDDDDDEELDQSEPRVLGIGVQRVPPPTGPQEGLPASPGAPPCTRCGSGRGGAACGVRRRPSALVDALVGQGAVVAPEGAGGGKASNLVGSDAGGRAGGAGAEHQAHVVG